MSDYIVAKRQEQEDKDALEQELIDRLIASICRGLPNDVARALRVDPTAGLLRQWSADNEETMAYTSAREIMRDIWQGNQADTLEAALLELTRATLGGKTADALRHAEKILELMSDQYVTEQADHIGQHHWE